MDVLSLPNNTLVMAYNDSPIRRSPLALAVSTDGGRSWKRAAVIENEPDGSFHYPALIYEAKKVRTLEHHHNCAVIRCANVPPHELLQ
jgi:hypothetical protein